MEVSDILAILRAELEALGKRSSFREAWPRGRRSAALDIALALGFTAAEVAQVLEPNHGAPAPIALGALGGLALVARRVAPLSVLALTILLFVLAEIVADNPLGLAALVALYTVTVVHERRISALALTVTAAASAGVAAVNGNSKLGGLGNAAAVAGFTVGVWALGTYIQMRRNYLRGLKERADLAEREREQLARIAVHEERAAIARELHDIVAHSVGVMLVGVRGARDVLRRSPEVADETLARVETSGEQSLAELRRILTLLRVSGNGAGSHPQPSLAQLDELVRGYRQAGVPVRLEIEGQRRSLPGGIELSVFRIVEEALTNVLKHAHPADVSVTLTYGSRELGLEILDDGKSEERPEGRPPGHGLLGMRERVGLLGGEFEAAPRFGGGFRVAVRLPIGGPA